MSHLALLALSLLMVSMDSAWSQEALSREQLTEELQKVNSKVAALEERMTLSDEIKNLGDKLTASIEKLGGTLPTANSSESRYPTTGGGGCQSSAALVNVALNKPARQSSTCCGGTASRAVDGNADPVYHNKHCTHTDLNSNPGPWWRVDLLESYEVRAVTITNRGDCCGEKLRDFHVEIFPEDPVGNPSATSTLCYYYPGIMPGGATQTLYCLQPTHGRYVRIRKPSITLTLCEVEVLVPLMA